MNTETAFVSPAAEAMLHNLTISKCKQQLLAFAHAYRRRLKDLGVADDVLAGALKDTLGEHARTCSGITRECVIMSLEALEAFYSNTDCEKDILGRIICHYCFHLPESSVALPARDSDLEHQCRGEVVPGTLPLPLVGYFLVMVRGGIEGIDPYRSMPILFGTSFDELGDYQDSALETAEDYRLSDEADAPIHWEVFFQDKRTQVLAVELLSRIHARLKDMPTESVLQIIENLQGKRRNRTGEVVMNRRFEEDEIRLLSAAIREAVTFLRQATQ
jgi:hypothetical protein